MDWQCPYPSNRSPVFAQNVVATSQPLATEAGIHCLRKGGNAVDAAIAAAITLTVVEPNNNGIGSDAFAIIHDGQSIHGLNASGRSPAKLDARAFKDLKQIPTLGWDPVTVPGAVSAWVEMSSKFGVLEFSELFEDAIHYASNGFQVGPKSSYFWGLAADRYKSFDAFMDTFMIDGRPPETGELIKLPDHAATLGEIASTRGESFYRGDLARLIEKDAQRHDAVFTAEDMANHKPVWVNPVSGAAFGHHLHEIPPNGQGLMALISLGVLKHLHNDLALDSADSVHLQIEAQRIAYTIAERHLADPDYMGVSIEKLLDEGFHKRLAAEISLAEARPRQTDMGASADTVYLTTADRNGLMVSMIQSNFRGFGSGIVVPGTGISLQNRGSGFVLEEGHPNQVGPGKLPYHTIIPGFVTKSGYPVMGFGVMGGHMQAQGHLQMMVRVALYGQNPQAASDAPRWYVFEDGRVALEKGFSEDVIASLASRGHDLVLDAPEHLFGGAQLIVKMKDGYCAGSDHRKEGLASGF